MVPPARSWGAVLALVPGLASCGAGSAGSSGDISAPTFAEVYATIVSTQCLPCHATGGVGQISGLLDLSTKELAYSNLVGVRSAGVSCATSGLTRVVAGNAAARRPHWAPRRFPHAILPKGKTQGTPSCGQNRRELGTRHPRQRCDAMPFARTRDSSLTCRDHPTASSAYSNPARAGNASLVP